MRLIARAPIVALAAAGILLIASVGAAQYRRGGRFGYGQLRENPPYDGSFQFCRIMFRNAMDGDGEDDDGRADGDAQRNW